MWLEGVVRVDEGRHGDYIQFISIRSGPEGACL